MTMNPLDNQRDFTRVPISIEVDLRPKEGAAFAALARDLSLNGVFVDCPQRLPVRSRCELSLYLGGRDSGIVIQIQGCVARSTDEGLGIEFTQIAGEDSFVHLRNLVRFNAARTDATQSVEQEFQTHLGLKRRPS